MLTLFSQNLPHGLILPKWLSPSWKAAVNTLKVLHLFRREWPVSLVLIQRKVTSELYVMLHSFRAMYAGYAITWSPGFLDRKITMCKKNLFKKLTIYFIQLLLAVMLILHLCVSDGADLICWKERNALRRAYSGKVFQLFSPHVHLPLAEIKIFYPFSCLEIKEQKIQFNNFAV